MDFNNRQLLALGLAAILIINMTLLALHKISEIIFWVVLGAIGVLWLILRSQWKQSR